MRTDVSLPLHIACNDLSSTILFISRFIWWFVRFQRRTQQEFFPTLDLLPLYVINLSQCPNQDLTHSHTLSSVSRSTNQSLCYSIRPEYNPFPLYPICFDFLSLPIVHSPRRYPCRPSDFTQYDPAYSAPVQETQTAAAGCLLPGEEEKKSATVPLFNLFNPTILRSGATAACPPVELNDEEHRALLRYRVNQ